MSTIVILGDGALGRAVADGARTAGHEPRLLGRPTGAGHPATAFDGADVVVEASRPDAVLPNVTAALGAGTRRIVIATTGWDSDRTAAQSLITDHGATVVASANFSLGAALFARLVDDAVALFGHAGGFDPFLVEWHRAGKRDRPSGTARQLASRIVAAHPRLRTTDDLEVVSIRAGASPGMHMVGFDASGETIELRLTARDRSAYAVGILAAADWLTRTPRATGIHTFDPVVDALLAQREVAA
jgi:4-hydroxy-tetrahydrodipicolinate reductase